MIIKTTNNNFLPGLIFVNFCQIRENKSPQNVAFLANRINKSTQMLFPKEICSYAKESFVFSLKLIIFKFKIVSFAKIYPSISSEKLRFAKSNPCKMQPK